VLSNRSFTLPKRPDHLGSGDSAERRSRPHPVTSPPPTTHRTAHALLALVAVLASAFVALSLSGPASAAAATACGDKVLADWFDNGRIDRLYPLHCYEDAIDAIPDDLRDYADAEEVISRALQSALRGELAPGGEDPTPGEDDPRPVGNGSNGPGSGGSGGSDDPGSEAAPDVDTSGPSSVPIPLLILGGMSVALLSAGGLGYLARRRQAAQDEVPGDDDFLV
jgi:hypothetical protein